jgi:preprotein translocase subunit Sss1
MNSISLWSDREGSDEDIQEYIIEIKIANIMCGKPQWKEFT